MESTVRIKATLKEMQKKFNESDNEYYYIKAYNGAKNYNGDENQKITFLVLLRHNEEIGSLERPYPYSFKSLDKHITLRLKERSVLPNEIEMNEEDFDEETSEEIIDYINDYLSNKYGYCNNGFLYKMKINISNIDWDKGE